MADDKKKQPIIIKKRKGGHGGAHGGAWKIALADMMTAMMAFFLVMWIIGMDVQTKQGIAEYFQNMSARATHEPASPNVIKMRGSPPVRPRNKPPVPRDANMDEQNAKIVQSQIDSLISSTPQLERMRSSIDVQISETEMRIELSDSGGNSLFVGESAQLKPDARRLVEGVAAIMRRNRAKVEIEGHSESRGQTGGAGGNGQSLWETSTARAVAVRGALADGGIGDERILMVKGMGDTQLKVKEDPANEANRRVVIVAPFDLASD
ncbi:MAG: OmpA family protein [Planctomycetes bacterium]|nr:OmpA family protein [Planctomycetota bacterium]